MTVDCIDSPRRSVSPRVATRASHDICSFTSCHSQVSSSIALDADIDSFNQTQFRYDLAAMYGVPFEWISLDVAAGSLVANFVITIPPDASIARSNATASALVSIISSQSTAQLASMLGMNVTSKAAPTMANITRTVFKLVKKAVTKVCPQGFWCSAGYEIACEKGFYNNMTNQDSQSGTSCDQTRIAPSIMSTREPAPHPPDRITAFQVARHVRSRPPPPRQRRPMSRRASVSTASSRISRPPPSNASAPQGRSGRAWPTGRWCASPVGAGASRRPRATPSAMCAVSKVP